MGNPVFKFTLTHANLGSIVISEPLGWKDAKLKMERHPTFYSLVEYFEGSFIFYGENNIDNGGADFIRQCENLYGFSTEIQILIEADIDGDGVFEETIFTGQLDLTQLKEVQDNKIEVPVIRNSLWSKFIARLDIPVNLSSNMDLDGNAITPIEPVDIDLISQKIRKEFSGYLLDTRVFTQDDLPTSKYIQLDVDTYTLNEIDTKYTLPIITNTEVPQGLMAVEEEGIYTFDLRVEASVFWYELSAFPDCQQTLNVVGTSSYLVLYLQINDETPVAFTETTSPLIFTDISTIYTYTGTRSLRKGDQIKIYADVTGDISTFDGYAQVWIYSKNNDAIVFAPTVLVLEDSCGQTESPDNPEQTHTDAPSQVEIPTYFNITADTTFPSSEAKGYLIHDAFAAVVQAITGSNCFYSEIFGRTDTNARQYDSNGCFSKNMLLKGLQVRGYTLEEKPFFASFNDLWNGANPMFCLGLGYDTVDGNEVIRLEKRGHYFNPGITGATFGNVRQISRVYDQALIYNKLTFGYQKWQSEDLAGIFDTQTKRTWSQQDITNIKNELSAISQFITASMAIEVTRRKTTEKKEDYKYDDEIINIALDDTTVSPDRYLPELDENFDSLSGLINSSTTYNLIHSCLRLLLRWGKWWNGSYQKYQSSSVNFQSGEGNSDMVSDYSCATGDQCLAVICDSLSEKQNISLASYGSVFGYTHLPLVYTVDIINSTWDDHLLSRNNKDGATRISQDLDNFKRFFIKELTYDICKGKCKILAWPFDEAPIRIIETMMPDRSESEPDEECPIYYIAEFASTLAGWTSDGGIDIPAPTFESLNNWDNAGIPGTFGWTIDADPSVTLNAGSVGDPVLSDYIRGEIDTITNLTYEFDWQIEVGSDNRTGQFKFMLLDADDNILDSETVPFHSTSPTDVMQGTTTLSPVGENGVYFAIQVIHTSSVGSCNFEIQSKSLSGGTGSVSVPLPSWAWSPNYAGSAKVEVSYEEYGVKNFILDPVTVPQEAHTIEIGYAVPVNNSNLSLRLRILDSSNVELYSNIFASDIADGDQKTASFNILDSDVWTDANRYEISVEELSTPVHFESGDEVYITKVEINICGDYGIVPFDAGYQAILDYADSIC